MLKKILFISCLIISFSFPALAVNPPSCPPKPDGDFGVQPAWQQVFPFDLVYPQQNPDTDIDDLSNCPQFNFWGSDFEMCSIPMIAGFVKNAALLMMTFRWLVSG